jgi:hypothetical protein
MKSFRKELVSFPDFYRTRKTPYLGSSHTRRRSMSLMPLLHILPSARMLRIGFEFHLGDAIEDRLIFKESPFESRSATDLLNLVSPAGKEAFLCPETDERNVIAAVMQFLIDEIFDKDFYCPIDTKGMDFLASIARSMRSLVPHRGGLLFITITCPTICQCSAYF